MNILDQDLPRVVIIGGGFAGLKLAKRINSKAYQVVLLDKNNYHSFQPLMYQVASSGLEPDSITYPIRKIFKGKPNFYFRMAEVQEVDTEQQTILTNIGSLRYDFLVIATGAKNNFFGMKNIEKYSYTMKSVVEALDLRSIILQNFENALNTTDLEERERFMNFVIVGGGPTGVELAGALAELKSHVLPKDYPDLDIRRMQIHLVEAGNQLLQGMSAKASMKATQFLRKMGVNIWTNMKVIDYDGSTVKTDQRTFKSRTMIWTAGVKSAGIKGIIDRTDRRIPVDEFNTLKGTSDVFVIGDIAFQSSEKHPNGLPMLASVAAQQGAHLGKNLNRLAKGMDMKVFSYRDKGTMATVGRNLAVVDLKRIKFAGIFAWLTWMFVHLMLLVDFRSRVIVFFNWVWSYILYDKGTRLILRKVPAKQKKSEPNTESALEN